MTTQSKKGVEMKSPDEWQRRSLSGEKKSDMAGEGKRKWGATMAPQTTIKRKVNYEIEIYKGFAGEVFENDSIDIDKPPLGEDTASALEPFNPNGETSEKPMTEMARATIAGVNSWWKTYFFLVKGFLGSGMLTLPMGFCNGGAAFSIGCMAVVCTFSILGMMTLLDVRNLYGGSFSDVAYQALGKYGKLAVDISLACCQVHLFYINVRLDTVQFTSSSFHKTSQLLPPCGDSTSTQQLLVKLISHHSYWMFHSPCSHGSCTRSFQTFLYNDACYCLHAFHTPGGDVSRKQVFDCRWPSCRRRIHY